MNSFPFISIITTVKNGNQFLGETLESVYNQSYKNYQHILIDDGSTDNTISIIEDFKNKFKDHRIKLIVTNGVGRAKALNLGVSNAIGEWIAIIDGDDLWHPQKLAYQVKSLNQATDILCTGSFLFNESEEIKYGPISDIAISKIERKMLLRSNRLSHSTILMRKNLCFYDETRISQFDYELWLRLENGNNNLLKINEVLAYHRIHINQSFEGRMGKFYRWRSFKLKFYYSFLYGDIAAILYNLLKLFFDVLLPRGLRLYIRNYYNE
jgi:glycosyltransferase involved in cell wall biosynthesis